MERILKASNQEHKISTKNMEINRKVLADLAIHDPETFAAIVREAIA